MMHILTALSCFISFQLIFVSGGHWITDDSERNSMLEVLRMVEREDAWPTQDAQRSLQEQWMQENVTDTI